MSTESRDNLQSKAVLTLLDLIGEGEIGGLVNGLKSVYLNDTPIQNVDGTYNFQGVTGAWTNGTNDQAPLPNFGNFSESPFTAGVQVKAETPYTFTISSPVADAVRIIMSIPALSYTDPNTGDISGTTVRYRFLRSVDNGPFVEIGAGSEWFAGGTVNAGPPPTAVAASGSLGVRATVSLTYNGETTLTTNGLTNLPGTDSVTVQAEEYNGTEWQALGGQKTLKAEWVSTGDFQSGGSDGDRFYTYALATDPYTVESSYTQVRFVVVSATGSSGGITITRVESKVGTSLVTVSGKSRSRYQRSHVLPIPRPASSVRFRVVRSTPDSTSAYLANETWIDSYAEITTLNMRYPNTALFGLRIDSQQFSSIPGRSYLVDGLKIQVPTNYDPETREYSGVWNGTFKRAVSSNPAWILYDLLTNTRYGLGNFIAPSQVDKSALYTIGRYCDEMVPDGFGGTEPRFTINTVIGSQGEAYKMISDITSVFRGMGYWDGGMVKLTQDAPSDPVMLYTPANVVDGAFNYTGSARKDRHSVVHVTWNDPDDNYKRKVEYVEDAELIAKYGVKKLDTLAFGCTSRGEAARVGRWILYTERYESDFITFKVGLDAAFVAPGDVIKIHDVMRAGKRAGGRLKSCTLTSATLDAPVEITSTPAVISLMMPDGSFLERELSNAVGTHSVVTFVGSLTTLPLDNAVYMISEPQLEPVLARVVSINQDGTTATTFEITAVESAPNKYSFIETGLKLERRKTSLLDPNFIETPSNLRVNEATYQSAPGVIANKIILSWYGNSTTYEVSWRRTSEGSSTNWQKTTVSNALTYEIFGVSPGVYEFSIVGINPLGARSTAVSTTFDAEGKVSPPSNVTNFAAQDSSGGVLLTWAAVPDIDLKSYEIRKSVIVDGVWSPWETSTFVATVPGVTTTYSAGPVVSGVTHQWQIKAIDTTGNYSQASTSVNFVKLATGGISIAHEYVGATLKLTWTSSNPPAAWRIKSGATWNGGTVLANSLTDNTFTTPVTWTTGQKFWVAPIDSAGAEGVPVSANVPFSVPAAPVLTGNQLGESLLLEWNTPASTLPIKGYELRYGATYETGTALGSELGNKAQYPITWATNQTVWIVTIDINGNAGPAGSLSYVALPPHAPVGLTATAGLTTVTLEWGTPTYPAHGYAEIFRSSTNVFADAKPIARTEVNSYADAVGSTNEAKYYWVRFVSLTNVGGDFSGPVLATTRQVGTGDLSALSVTAQQLADGTLTLPKFASGLQPIEIATSLPTTKTTELVSFGGSLYRWDTTTSSYVKMNATVNATDIQGQIQNAQIAGLAASKITGQLTDTQLADLSAAKLTGQITSTQITDNAITTAKLSAGAVTADQLAANAVTAGKIAANAVTAAEIAAGTITSAKIAAGTILASNIAANTITANQIAANTITANQIAANTITAAQIAAGTITATEIAANAITATKIAAGAIAVGSAVIANGAISNAMIASLAVDEAKIANGAITNAKIADAAITNAKIANVIQSNDYSAGLAGWKIDKLGQMEMNNGTFRGTIDVKSGTTNARMEIKNNSIKVYDANGVLRVQIGDLTA